MSTSPSKRVRVLLTNDDGPPGPASPFIYGFAKMLVEVLDWDVRVVVPSNQQSWVGNSFRIAQQTTAQYYYPTQASGGLDGVKSDLPLRDANTGNTWEEWVLVDGTPATCSNLALYSIYPPGSFDLVIAGPNYGRNTSTAFALSSGTLGSALSASLTSIPAIALSYGLMEGYKPASPEMTAGATRNSVEVCRRLWELGWGNGTEKVDVYTVNVPILPSMLHPIEFAEVQWTSMARTEYQRLFKSVSTSRAPSPEVPMALTSEVGPGGPSSIPEPVVEPTTGVSEKHNSVQKVDAKIELQKEHLGKAMVFKFSPDIGSLINPLPSTLKPGSDTHALHSGAISITPVRAAFEPVKAPNCKTEGFVWKL